MNYNISIFGKVIAFIHKKKKINKITFKGNLVISPGQILIISFLLFSLAFVFFI